MRKRKQESGLNQLFHFLVTVPWWVGPILAALVFLGLRAIIPAILLSGNKPDDMFMKTFSTTLANFSKQFAPIAFLGMIFIWGIAELKKLIDRRRLESQTGIESIRALHWRDCEELTAEAFRRQGYQVEVTGSPAGDGGIDIILRRNGQLALVQCKQWRSWSVGVKIVRELRGMMASEQAEHGIVVACGSFTADAERFASENGIKLICGNDLVEMIQSVQKTAKAPARLPEPVGVATDDRPQPRVVPSAQATPACPLCGATMVLRTARKGANAGSKFWGCQAYPRCRGVRPA